MIRYFIGLFLLFGGELFAQNYSAIHGSNYSGSLGVYNNPSSIVNSPHQWDFTLFGFQYTAITNSLQGRNFPFYLLPSAKFSVAEGNYARNADIHYNARVFNGRFAINRNNVFAFGLNMRGYVQGSTGQINYNDTVIGPRSFLSLNTQNRSLDIRMAESLWMELYASYGLTVLDREGSRLNAGITLKVLRSMSGAFARVENIGVESVQENDQVLFKISNGAARYGYSANHRDASSFEAADLFSNSQTGLAFDIGAEYLVKPQGVSSVSDEDGYNDYDWKIGVSILDIGKNRFRYGSESRAVSMLNDDVSSDVLQQKFTEVENLASFNDSLATIVDQSEQLTGNFNILNPTRLVINIDRYVSGNFYLNGELSVNFHSDKQNKYAVVETRLITVTPRWETRKFGVYMPVQYTRHGNFWIGAAIKAGPLLLGTHNIANAFSRNKYTSGGAYIAITIRPWEFMSNPRNKQYECPSY